MKFLLATLMVTAVVADSVSKLILENLRMFCKMIFHLSFLILTNLIAFW